MRSRITSGNEPHSEISAKKSPAVTESPLNFVQQSVRNDAPNSTNALRPGLYLPICFQPPT
jgi:hypothetical protein